MAIAPTNTTAAAAKTAVTKTAATKAATPLSVKLGISKYLSAAAPYFGWLKLHWLGLIVGVVVGWLVLKYTIQFLRFIHQVWISRNLVYIKVTLPRSDSKLDQEKRTE